MKSLIALLLFISITVCSYGQTASVQLTKKWHLTELEEFGDKFEPTEEQQKDWIEFKSGQLTANTLKAHGLKNKVKSISQKARNPFLK